MKNNKHNALKFLWYTRQRHKVVPIVGGDVTHNRIIGGSKILWGKFLDPFCGGGIRGCVVSDQKVNPFSQNRRYMS